MADDVVMRAESLGKKYVIGRAAERERQVALRDVTAGAPRGISRARGRVSSSMSNARPLRPATAKTNKQG